MTASSNNIGQRIASPSRYIRHPSTGWLEDGDPLDAGTSIILANNINHLAYESVRPIADDWYTDAVGGKASASGYTSLIDATAPTGAALQNWNKISWSVDPGVNTTLGCARCYPLVLIADAIPPYGTDPTFRWIRCHIRAKSGASNSLQIAVAITPWNTSPIRGVLWAPRSDSSTFWTTVSTSETSYVIDLQPEVIVDGNFPRETVRSENEGPNNTINHVFMGLLWFGWYATNASDYWRSFSAYEYREE